MGAEVTIPGRISSAITLASAVRTATAPTVHLFFPCLKYRAVSVMCGKLGLRREKAFMKGVGHHRRLCSVGSAITAAAAILYTRLTASVFSKEGCPQVQVGVDHVICHGANNRESR